MDQTPNLNLPIPNADAVPPTNISDEFPRIALALTMLDTIIHALQGVVEGKAEADHTQAMSTITGLVEALADKMPADTTFSLDDLEDVMGAADALVNYVLVKNASGFWVPSTALAALGVHNHAISEVVGLADLLDEMSEALDLLIANKAEKTTTVTGAGLATGGGSLAANRVITVTKATDAEHQARERDDVAATPKGIGLALVAYNKWKRIGGVRTSASLFLHTNLSEFRRLLVDGSIRSVSTAGAPILHFSSDNGASWITSSTYEMLYAYHITGTSASGTTFASTGNQFMASGNVLSSSRFSRFRLDIGEFNIAQTTSMFVHYMAHLSNAGYLSGEHSGHQTSLVAMNAFRINCTQPMEADYELMGLPT